MKLRRTYRRDCIRLRDDMHAQWRASVRIICGEYLASKVGCNWLVWRNSERTGRPRLVSVWDNGYQAGSSMGRAANTRYRQRCEAERAAAQQFGAKGGAK